MGTTLQKRQLRRKKEVRLLLDSQADLGDEMGGLSGKRRKGKRGEQLKVEEGGKTKNQKEKRARLIKKSWGEVTRETWHYIRKAETELGRRKRSF